MLKLNLRLRGEIVDIRTLTLIMIRINIILLMLILIHTHLTIIDNKQINTSKAIRMSSQKPILEVRIQKIFLIQILIQLQV